MEIEEKLFLKCERMLLRWFLLSQLQKLFYELFEDVVKYINSDSVSLEMEYYVMDSKIIQCIIRSILGSEEYTLEGIARYTRVPFDVIFDAACGNNRHLSITSWLRIVDLYLQTNPEISEKLLDRLQNTNAKKEIISSVLRNEA